MSASSSDARASTSRRGAPSRTRTSSRAMSSACDRKSRCRPSNRRPCTSAACATGARRSSSSAKGCAAYSATRRRLMTDLVRAANDNNTAIYAIDPRGLAQQRFPSLWEAMASETGGDYFRSNDLDRAFKQVVVRVERLLPARLRADRPAPRRTVPQDQSSGEAVGARCARARWATGRRAWPKSSAPGSRPPKPSFRRTIVRALSELPAATARRTVDFWVGTALDSGRPIVRLSWVPRERCLARCSQAGAGDRGRDARRDARLRWAGGAGRRVVRRASGVIEGDLHGSGQRQRHHRSRCPGDRRARTRRRRRSG